MAHQHLLLLEQCGPFSCRQASAALHFVEQHLALSGLSLDTAGTGAHHHFFGEFVLGSARLSGPNQQTLRHCPAQQSISVRVGIS